MLLRGAPETVELRPIVVGIDASPTGTGLVALSLAEGECLAHRRIRSARIGANRLVFIRSELKTWLGEIEFGGHQIVHVCMEGYSFGSKVGQSFTIAEVGGLVKLVLLDYLASPVGFPSIPAPTQVKKFASGTGTAAKDQVSKFVLKKWGADMPNNDEADAYVLAQMARAIVRHETGHRYEADTLAAMKKASSIHAELGEVEKYALDVWR